MTNNLSGYLDCFHIRSIKLPIARYHPTTNLSDCLFVKTKWMYLFALQ